MICCSIELENGQFELNNKIFPLTLVTQGDIIFGGMVRRLPYCIISSFPPDKKALLDQKQQENKEKTT